MQKQNIREYELMRNELISIKTCITSYMRYVLGGSGAVLFGMSAIKTTNNPFFLSYAPAGASVILLLVLLVLFYKFNSHNTRC